MRRLRLMLRAIRRNPLNTLLWVVVVFLLILLPWGLDLWAL